MSFTDEDLKRFKDCTNYIGRDFGNAMEALLSRLEAAELAISSYLGATCTQTTEYKAWRKAAGK